MNYILYILPLSNEEGFKIGITENENLSRIGLLNSIYDFNLKEGYIVKSKRNIIKSLERQILNDYNYYKYDVSEKLDGHSEFLNMDCFEFVLEDINFKNRLDHISLEINKGIELEERQLKQSKEIDTSKYIQKFDFKNIENFLLLIKQNTDKLLYKKEIVEKDGISGIKHEIYCKEHKLTKEIFDLAFFEEGDEKLYPKKFAYSTKFIKNGECTYNGIVKLAPIHFDFRYEKTFNNKMEFDKIYALYNELNVLLTKTYSKESFQINN